MAVVGHEHRSGLQGLCLLAHTHQLGLLLCLLRRFLCFLLLFLQGFLRLGLLLLLTGSKTGRHHTRKNSSVKLPSYFLPESFFERWGKAFQPRLTHIGTASHWLLSCCVFLLLFQHAQKKQQRLNQTFISNVCLFVLLWLRQSSYSSTGRVMSVYTVAHM